MRRRARLAALFLLAELAAVVFIPLLLHMDGNSSVGGFWESPSLTHPLGTDDVGRDLLARVLLGGRASLLVGFGSALLSVLLGVPLGLLAGYKRGVVGGVIMRLADICQAFPSTVAILCLASLVGPSVSVLIAVLGVLGWTGIARLVYAGTLKTRELAYVDAARLAGVSGTRLLWQEILPNVFTPVLPAATIRAGRAILTESSMSFLGVGIRTPNASWGNIIHLASNLSVLSQRPWVWLVPGFCIVLTVLALNRLAEYLERCLTGEEVRSSCS